MIKDTNPDHYKVDDANFIEYINDPKVSEFGNWMFANGYNSGIWASSNWISVKDRMPEAIRGCNRHAIPPVLLYSPKGGFYVGWYYCEYSNGFKEFWNRTSEKSAQTITTKVTHWMPLPEPPNGDSQI